MPVPPGSSMGHPLVGCDGSISDHHYRSLRGDFEDSSLGNSLEVEHAIFGRCALCRLGVDSSLHNVLEWIHTLGRRFPR